MRPPRLVSAGAGSGKTHRIVEEVVALVRDGVSVDRVAAVTFTEAAAAELQERLRLRLLAEGLRDEAARVEGAMICTIHRFALTLLTRFPLAAGVAPAPMVLDDGGKVAERLGLPRWLRVNVAPTVLSFPWGLTFGFPPPYVPVPTRIVMDVLPPIAFERRGEEAACDDAYVERCHQRVVTAMQARLDEIVQTEEIGVRARLKRRWPGAEPVGRFLEDLAESIMERSPFVHAA